MGGEHERSTHDPAMKLSAEKGDATLLRTSACLRPLRAELERMGLTAPRRKSAVWRR
jgi:hypothetical protein